MKKGFLIAGIVLIILGVIWLLKSHNKSTVSLMQKGVAAANKSLLTNSSTSLTNDSNLTVPPSGSTPSAIRNVDLKALIIAGFMAAQNAKSLDFYGKIIDQNNEPVTGVKVTARVGLYLGITHSGGYNTSVLSDSKGLFSFTHIHGAGTGFTLGKNGYQFDQSLPVSSRPEDYLPDPSKPVIFHMWKLQGAEPMIHTTINARIPYDGQSASFDLSMGHKSENGNFKVSLIRNPLEIQRGGPPFDWNVTISAEGGGLVETSDLYQNLAPQTGYQSVLQFREVKDNPHWTQSLVKTFYIHQKNGTYGKVSIDLVADSNRPDIGAGVGISIESWINPSGSRNLEFDPSKQINP